MSCNTLVTPGTFLPSLVRYVRWLLSQSSVSSFAGAVMLDVRSEEMLPLDHVPRRALLLQGPGLDHLVWWQRLDHQRLVQRLPHDLAYTPAQPPVGPGVAPRR